jgi:HSP20 family protein
MQELIMFAVAHPAARTLIQEFFRDADTASSSQGSWTPKADIIEYEGGTQVRLDLPGVAKEAVTVELKDNVLTISGEKPDPVAQSQNYRYRESQYGSFKRTFRVSQAIDREHIEARFENGVLDLRLAHKPEAGSRTIPVL